MITDEPNDFNPWESHWMKFDRKINRLIRVRREIEHDQRKKDEKGIPTSYDLACWFRKSL